MKDLQFSLNERICETSLNPSLLGFGRPFIISQPHAQMTTNYLQLIAKGAQDKHLTSNPQISFFKAVYKRYTNFGKASVEVPMMGDTSFGGLCRAILPRRGDLVADTYISIELPAVTASGPDMPTVKWTNKLGHAMIEYVEVAIGNEVIDRHTGEYLEILSQLTQSDEKRRLYNNMIGHKGSLINDMQQLDPQFLYIPLQFWFCKGTGCAIPMCALQIHDVEVRVKLRKAEELLLTFSPENFIDCGRLENISLFVDYYYLDEMERRVFINSPHTYLIEQVQYSGPNDVGGSRGNNVDLFFNHPVKELIWVGQRATLLSNQFALNDDGYPDYNNYFCYGSSSTPGEALNMFDTFLLQINGNDLMPVREANYFNIYEPWLRHTNAPDVGVFCYSFCIDPDKYQPTGTLNFSRLDSSSLKVEFNETASLPCIVKVYARNLNVLEILGGQASLAYSQ